MAVGDISLESLDMSWILNIIWALAGLFLVIIFAGFLIGAFFYLRRRERKKNEMFEIGWWEVVQDQMIPGLLDKAEEVIIPGTNLRFFYIKDKDLYLPRFTRGIKKNLFYVCITPNREMVNFTLQSLTNDKKAAALKYDHTDMRWAAENAREFIKRNYKDKAQKWWQAYQGAITTAIYILIMTFSFVIIIYFMRGMVEDLGRVAAAMGSAADKLSACSGVRDSGLAAAASLLGIRRFK